VDAATPAVETTNEGTPQEPIYNDPLPPATTEGSTSADQLVDHGLSWKSYQESLPPYGADGVNNSDGLLSDVTPLGPFQSAFLPKLYAVKHNPFVYFADVEGSDPSSA
jgi:phospholipase C